MAFLADIVQRVFQLFILLIIVQVVLSYFVDPYQPVRQNLDRLINPFLEPIRRFIPPVGGLDFSPVVLIIVLQIISAIIDRLLRSLG
jgi:YggT family protein